MLALVLHQTFEELAFLGAQFFELPGTDGIRSGLSERGTSE
jgi:hypothetical protein